MTQQLSGSWSRYPFCAYDLIWAKVQSDDFGGWKEASKFSDCRIFTRFSGHSRLVAVTITLRFESKPDAISGLLLHVQNRLHWDRCCISGRPVRFGNSGRECKLQLRMRMLYGNAEKTLALRMFSK
jgi:hypothetical protein